MHAVAAEGRTVFYSSHLVDVVESCASALPCSMAGTSRPPARRRRSWSAPAPTTWRRPCAVRREDPATVI